MKRNYPATRAGLKRMTRDLERSAEPIRIPVQTTSGYPIPPQPPMPGAEVHHHYAPVVTVSVSGDGHAVAVGDHSHVSTGGPDAQQELLARLREVLARLDDLELGVEERDEVHDAVDAAERIAAEPTGDRRGLFRRAARVVQVLGQVAASPGANALAGALAEPIRGLLS